MKHKDCPHLKDLNSTNIINKSNYIKFECEECIKVNSKWIQLRICQTCGKMLCCESSPNQHMYHHHQDTNHPVISSAELGENWLYCYKDKITKDL